MASSNIPVRVPARPASPVDVASPRPAVWRQDKKPSRFVIKLGGAVPC